MKSRQRKAIDQVSESLGGKTIPATAVAREVVRIARMPQWKRDIVTLGLFPAIRKWLIK